ncbi:MAG TPA: glycoside hydrolase family 2 protein [Spirochaetales bacterium]|nr:glycoside hydrolase family 2 protein [Spirochaetales bacterium]
MESLSLAGSWLLKAKTIQESPFTDTDGHLDSASLERLAKGIPAAIPGDIVSALFAAGLIPDPYEGTNELKIQWVGKADWVLEREFTLTAPLFNCKRLFLSIDVLDTVADVYVNGRLAGTGDDMFIPRRWDVQDFVRQGKNKIEIVIFSPVKLAAKRAGNLTYPIPESVYPVSSPHRNLVRKAQCMSGWDWGPCIMTGGICDNIAIIGTDGPRIESVQTRLKALQPDTDTDFDWESAKRTGQTPDFDVSVAVEVDSKEQEDAILEITLAGVTVRKEVHVQEGNSLLVEHLRIKQPRLWWPVEQGEQGWPAKQGEQALYKLTVRLRDFAGHSTPNGSMESDYQSTRNVDTGDTNPGKAGPGGVFCEVEKNIGFRELRVSTQNDEIGREMTFVVNGKKVFAKGANWIPADALPSRWTETRLRTLLRAAVAAHMNCLRVWGGGRYESDTFYNLCDEYGIMVWQDCAFSCALYPSDARFLATVEEEIRAQVKRLSDHPSLALWCGNNEALGAITWYEESRAAPERYKKDYELLTYGVLGKVIQELDPDRCWWPSSPSAGLKDFSDNWHADSSGDMHFWSVWHEAKPFSEYLTVKPRFCSEFGFQSYPSAPTIELFADPSERCIGSPTLKFHERDPKGEILIGQTLERYFGKQKGYLQTIYASQVQQAMAIKTAVEFWRSCKPRCMGTLYWQLNDVWPAISWSSIEYSGLWKLLHYEARRFYDPLLPALFLQDESIKLFVVSDFDAELDVTCTVRFCAFDGATLAETNLKAQIAPQASMQLWSLPVKQVPASPQDCYVEASIQADILGKDLNANIVLERTSTLLLAEPKSCHFKPTRLVLQRKETGDREAGSYGVRAECAPAFFVQACDLSGQGQFDDAGFYLRPGQTKELRFQTLAQASGAMTANVVPDFAAQEQRQEQGTEAHQAGTIALFDLASLYTPLPPSNPSV